MFNKILKIFNDDISFLQFIAAVTGPASGIAMAMLIDLDKSSSSVIVTSVPMFWFMLLALITAIVKIGAMYVEYATRGEYTIPSDWMLFDDKGLLHSLTLYWYILVLTTYTLIVLYYTPLSITIGILLIIGLTALSRFVFGIMGKLDTHVNDADAHLKKK